MQADCQLNHQEFFLWMEYILKCLQYPRHNQIIPGQIFFLLKLSALVEEFVVWQIEQKVFIRFSTAELFHTGVSHIFVHQFCRSRWRLCFGKVQNKDCKCKKGKSGTFDLCDSFTDIKVLKSCDDVHWQQGKWTMVFTIHHRCEWMRTFTHDSYSFRYILNTYDCVWPICRSSYS